MLMNKVMKNIISKLILNILKYFKERIKIEKSKNLLLVCMTKLSMRNLKALNHRLVLKKVLRVIKFNQNAWLKPCTGINNKLLKEEKNFLRKTL